MHTKDKQLQNMGNPRVLPQEFHVVMTCSWNFEVNNTSLGIHVGWHQMSYTHVSRTSTGCQIPSRIIPMTKHVDSVKILYGNVKQMDFCPDIDKNSPDA